MAAGQAGPDGVVVQPVFAREISKFEQERAPIHYQLKMEFTVMETTLSKRTVGVSTTSMLINFLFGNTVKTAHLQNFQF